MSITLPIGMADAVKQRVASGSYASESEVVREGLRALFARESAVEEWLRTEVMASYDELRADPSRGIESEDVRRYLLGLRGGRGTENKS
ncbi:MAG: type II toxin-antitoxin system ParD family antitoxin [Micropruina sp.]